MLVGRDAERATIGALLDAARTSRSECLVVRGEAGMGKTALLEDAREQAGDMRVLMARGVESESDLAFAGLHQLLRPALYLLDALPAPQAAALRGAFGLSERSGEDRFLIAAGCLTLLSELAEQGPVLCLVDDIQWLDGPSTDALLFVARRIDAEGIVLLFAAREDDTQHFEPRGVPTLRVGELDRAAAAALLVSRADSALADVVRDALVEQASGNALALVELASALTAEQLAGRDALPAALPVSWSLADLFLTRVRRLPESAQRLVLVAAADDTGDVATVARAAEILELAPEALDAAEAARLVKIEGGRLEFRHPLVRSATYYAASPAERRSVHRAIAEAAGNADEDRRAWHLAAAATGPDDEIASVLEASAERSRRRSGFAAAANALERSAELSVTPEDAARRHVAAAAAAWHAGQPERARLLLQRARGDSLDDRTRVELEHVRGTVELWCGRLPAAYDALVAAGDAAFSVDPALAVEVLFDAAGAALWTGALDRVVEASRRAAALPQASSDDDYVFLVHLLSSLSEIWSGGGVDRVRELVGAELELTEPRWLAWAAAGASFSGDEARAQALLRRASALARETGAVDALTFVLIGVTVSGLFEGRLDLEVDALEGLTLAREAGLTNGASLQLAVLAWLAGVKGNEEECAGSVAGMREPARAAGCVIASAIAHWGVSLLDLGLGRVEDAALRLEEIRADPSLRHPRVVLPSTADLVEALQRVGRTDEARAAVAPLENFVAVGGPRWAEALVARCRALLAGPEHADAEFRRALEIHAESTRAFDQARTALLYGEWLRRERRRVDARPHLRAAVTAFDELGAEPWAERARAELRASGETARRRDPTTVDLLTPQELQIARLVAEGLSNKEVAAQLFLSPRTIQYHLRHVFVKLDITSRTQLARLVLSEDALATAR